MGRLIDADKLLEETKKDRDYAEKNGFWDMYYERQTLIDRIEAQPTAYYPEKIMEQLENERKFWENAYNRNLGKEKARSYEHAIEIVKGGGKEKDIATCAKDDIEKDLC